MDTLPSLRWQNATEVAAGNCAEELTPFLTQVQEGSHYQCRTLENSN